MRRRATRSCRPSCRRPPARCCARWKPCRLPRSSRRRPGPPPNAASAPAPQMQKRRVLRRRSGSGWPLSVCRCVLQAYSTAEIGNYRQHWRAAHVGPRRLSSGCAQAAQSRLSSMSAALETARAKATELANALDSERQRSADASRVASRADEQARASASSAAMLRDQLSKVRRRLACVHDCPWSRPVWHALVLLHAQLTVRPVQAAEKAAQELATQQAAADKQLAAVESQAADLRERLHSLEATAPEPEPPPPAMAGPGLQAAQSTMHQLLLCGSAIDAGLSLCGHEPPILQVTSGCCSKRVSSRPAARRRSAAGNRQPQPRGRSPSI